MYIHCITSLSIFSHRLSASVDGVIDVWSLIHIFAGDLQAKFEADPTLAVILPAMGW